MNQHPVALVTGASRGIGRAIAQALCEEGFYVIGTATSGSGVAAISEALGGKGRGALLQLSEFEAFAPFVAQLFEKEGRIDALVNNAGITDDGLMLRMSPVQWQRVLDVNLSGTFRLTQEVAKLMIKARYGRIVNLSSVVASSGNAGQANYIASKAGLEGLTRALAVELAGRNITVNAVAPGFTETDMTSGLKDEWKSELIKRIPAGRMGKAEEVAQAVRFLASAAAGYITGIVLPVNGGMHLR